LARFFAQDGERVFRYCPVRKMRRAIRIIAALLAVSLPLVGCKAEEDQSAGAASPLGASRCTRGLVRAAKAPTEAEATTIYYEECAELFSQPGCRDGWRAAAKLPAAEQVGLVADACRKAYCPSLKAFSFEICRDDFTATPATLLKAWPPLFDAIVAKEAGPATQDVSSAMLVLYAHLKQIGPAIPPPSSAEPSAVAPAPSGSAGVPATSASAGVPGGATAPAGSGSVVDKAAKSKAKPALPPKSPAQ
jgi:hypothetical protein